MIIRLSYPLHAEHLDPLFIKHTLELGWDLKDNVNAVLDAVHFYTDSWVVLDYIQYATIPDDSMFTCATELYVFGGQ